MTAQDLVVCYQRDGCSSSGLVFDGVTIQDCCDNVNGGGLGGIGLGASYQHDGIVGCLICQVGKSVHHALFNVNFGLEWFHKSKTDNSIQACDLQ